MSQQGNSFQLAVAVPVKNHKFEFGQNYVCMLQNGIDVNAQYIQIDNTIYTGADLIVQYRNQILLGPSSHPDNPGATEHVTVSGAYPLSTAGYTRFYLLNKNNKYKYDAGDRISFYGTGLAGGWTMSSTSWLNAYKRYFSSQGIQKGAISTHYWPSFSHDPNLNQGTYDANYSAAGAYLKMHKVETDPGFFLDMDYVYGDKMQYVMDPLYVEAGRSQFRVAMLAQVYTSPFYALLGEYHRGGWRKQYAQRISIQIDDSTPSGFFFTQDLVKAGSEDLRDRSLVIPYQYYRIGGRIYIDATHCSAKVGYDNYYMSMSLRPNTQSRDVGGVFESIFVNFANLPVHNDTWLNFSTVGLLKSGISNETPPSINLWFGNNGIAANNAGPLDLYIDDLFVEHAGGIQYANQDGCLDFGRYSTWPDEESLKIEKINREGTSSLYGQKERYVVTCRFPYVPQTFWDQFELLMEWQEKGFLLNLHPYINDLPNSLMGRVVIKEYAKDNWDLSLRSFTMEFTEE